MTKILSKHVLEVRFKPNSRILDKRGEIAEALSNVTFDQWNISANAINFASTNNPDLSAFFSYRNFGLLSSYPNSTEEFLKKSKEYLQAAWQYFPTNQITRMGVRSTFLLEVSSFKEAFDTYRRMFLKLDDEQIKKFGGDLIDLGFPLNFLDGENFFNINTGPMEKEQSKQFMIEHEDLPHAGIYIDIDYFKKSFSPHIIQKHAFAFIEEGVKKAQQQSDLFQGWFLNKK